MRPEFSILLPYCKGIVNWQCKDNPVEIRFYDNVLFKFIRKLYPKLFTQNAMAYALGVNTHNLSKFELGYGKIKSIPFNPVMLDEYLIRIRDYHNKGVKYFKENKRELTSPERVDNNKYVNIDNNQLVTLKENIQELNEVDLSNEEINILDNILIKTKSYIEEIESNC